MPDLTSISMLKVYETQDSFSKITANKIFDRKSTFFRVKTFNLAFLYFLKILMGKGRTHNK